MLHNALLLLSLFAWDSAILQGLSPEKHATGANPAIYLTAGGHHNCCPSPPPPDPPNR